MLPLSSCSAKNASISKDRTSESILHTSAFSSASVQSVSIECDVSSDNDEPASLAESSVRERRFTRWRYSSFGWLVILDGKLDTLIRKLTTCVYT